MRIGYARVSTDDQTLDLQLDALKRAKCRKIYEEHASGKNTIRPELEACLKSLREDDTLVIWRLDRLGRSLGDLIELTNELQSRSIDFGIFNREAGYRFADRKACFSCVCRLGGVRTKSHSRADPWRA